MEVSGELHAPAALHQSPCTHWIGGWVGRIRKGKRKNMKVNEKRTT
jgi:hypothetical protein